MKTLEKIIAEIQIDAHANHAISARQIARRERWKKYFNEVSRINSAKAALMKAWFDNKGPRPPYMPIPEFPEDLRDLTCGAKTRAGHFCRMTNLYANGRCKFHGGLSTGPRTPEGKNRSSRNAIKRTEKQGLDTIS